MFRQVARILLRRSRVWGRRKDTIDERNGKLCWRKGIRKGYIARRLQRWMESCAPGKGDLPCCLTPLHPGARKQADKPPRDIQRRGSTQTQEENNNNKPAPTRLSSLSFPLFRPPFSPVSSQISEI